VRTAAATFITGLQHEAVLGHRAGRGVAVNAFLQRDQEVIHGDGGFEFVDRFAGEFAVGIFLEPLGAVLGRDGEELFEVDDGRGGHTAVLAFALEADGCAGGSLDAEAHDGLIDRADFFHVERTVADAFAFEDAEFFQDAMNRAVADKGQCADRIAI